MRLIKFRVRRKDSKGIVAYEWYTKDRGWLHCSANNPEQVFEGIYRPIEFGWKDDSDHLREEFTTKLDENGLEIYENDSVRVFNDAVQGKVIWDMEKSRWGVDVVGKKGMISLNWPLILKRKPTE